MVEHIKNEVSLTIVHFSWSLLIAQEHWSLVYNTTVLENVRESCSTVSRLLVAQQNISHQKFKEEIFMY